MKAALILATIFSLGFSLSGCATPETVYYVMPDGVIQKDYGQTFETVTEIPDGAKTVNITLESLDRADNLPREKKINCVSRTDLFGITRTKCE